MSGDKPVPEALRKLIDDKSLSRFALAIHSHALGERESRARLAEAETTLRTMESEWHANRHLCLPRETGDAACPWQIQVMKIADTEEELVARLAEVERELQEAKSGDLIVRAMEFATRMKDGKETVERELAAVRGAIRASKRIGWDE